MNSKEIIVANLCEAIEKNNLPLIDELLKQNPEIINIEHPKDKLFPIDYCVRSNRVDAFELLVKNKAILNTDYIVYSLFDINNAFLERFILNNPFGTSDINALHLQAIKGIENPKQLQTLLSSCHIDSKDKWYRTPLLLAIANKKFDTANLLLSKGASKSAIKNWKSPKSRFPSLFPLLSFAILLNNNEMCEYLISNKLINDIDEEDAYHNTPLNNALFYNRFTSAQLLMANGAARDKAQNVKFLDQNTFLHYAATRGNLELCKFLIKNKLVKNLNEENANKCTALILALQNNHFDVAEFLLSQGDNASAKKVKSWKDPKKFNGNLLHFAAINGNTALCEFLIKHRLVNKIDSEDDTNATPLCVSLLEDRLETAQFLISQGASKEAAKNWKNGMQKNKNGMHKNKTLLHYAAKAGMTKTVIFLLENKLVKNIDAIDASNRTPLIAALTNKRFEVADILLKYNPNKHFVRKWERIPSSGKPNLNQGIPAYLRSFLVVDSLQQHSNPLLHFAAKEGDIETCRYLIENGLVKTIDEVNANKATPLIIALVYNHLDVAEYLLQKGADIEVVKKWRHPKYYLANIFHIAASQGHLTTCQFLVSKGIIDEIDELTDNHASAFIFALYFEHIDLAKYLLEHGSLDKTKAILFADAGFGYLLNQLASEGKLKSCEFLINHQLIKDIDQEGPDNLTPLAAALQNFKLETAQLFLANNASKDKVRKLAERNPDPVHLLHDAIIVSNLTACKFLLKNKLVDVNAKDSNGETALSYSESFGEQLCTQLLLSYGAIVEQKSEGRVAYLFRAPATQWVNYDETTGKTTATPLTIKYDSVVIPMKKMFVLEEISTLKHMINEFNSELIKAQRAATIIENDKASKKKYFDYKILMAIQKYAPRSLNLIEKEIRISELNLSDKKLLEIENIRQKFTDYQNNHRKAINQFNAWHEKQIIDLPYNEERYKEYILGKANYVKSCIPDFIKNIETFNAQMSECRLEVNSYKDSTKTHSRAQDEILKIKAFETEKINALIQEIERIRLKPQSNLSQPEILSAVKEIDLIVNQYEEYCQDFEKYKQQAISALNAFEKQKARHESKSKKIISSTEDSIQNKIISTSHLPPTKTNQKHFASHVSNPLLHNTGAKAEFDSFPDASPNPKNTGMNLPPMDNAYFSVSPPENNPEKYYHFSEEPKRLEDNMPVANMISTKEGHHAMMYCKELFENYQNGFSEPDSDMNKKIWRLSVSYYITMIINALLEMLQSCPNDDELLQKDLAKLRAHLTRHISFVEERYFTLSTVNQLKHIYEDYKENQTISTGKVQQFVDHFKGSAVWTAVKQLVKTNQDNAWNKSVKIQLSLTKLKNTLQEISDISFSWISQDNLSLEVLLEKYPHHYSSVKMLIACIDEIFISLKKSGITIPENIMNCFSENTNNPTLMPSQRQDIHLMRNKINHQIFKNDAALFKYIILLCKNIDNSIKLVQEWDNTLQNHISRLPLAPTLYATPSVTPLTMQAILSSQDKQDNAHVMFEKKT